MISKQILSDLTLQHFKNSFFLLNAFLSTMERQTFYSLEFSLRGKWKREIDKKFTLDKKHVEIHKSKISEPEYIQRVWRLYHGPSEKWAICCSSPRYHFRMGRTGIEALLSLLSKYMQEMASLFKVIVSNLLALILIYTPNVAWDAQIKLHKCSKFAT